MSSDSVLQAVNVQVMLFGYEHNYCDNCSLTTHLFGIFSASDENSGLLIFELTHADFVGLPGYHHPQQAMQRESENCFRVPINLFTSSGTYRNRRSVILGVFADASFSDSILSCFRLP